MSCREAEPLFHRALSGFEELLGPTHPQTLTAANDLALLLEVLPWGAPGAFGVAWRMVRLVGVGVGWLFSLLFGWCCWDLVVGIEPAGVQQRDCLVEVDVLVDHMGH